MAFSALVLPVLFLLVIQTAASDPSPLQDFCVADTKANVFVNGVVCKNPAQVKAEDFFFSGLDKRGDTNNRLKSMVTAVNVNNLVGLNSLGVSLARVDFARGGLNPPHLHPRATEVLTVLKGQLYVGFVTSNPPKLFAKVLHSGDVFVFPQGLIHFQLNTGRENAVALAAFSSQNPGVVTVANALFGSNPQIEDIVLDKAFQVDDKVVDYLKSKFSNDN